MTRRLFNVAVALVLVGPELAVVTILVVAAAVVGWMAVFS